MADTEPVRPSYPEPKLENLTWIEVTRLAEEILVRFENDETTFKRWEVKVVWEYWRGFEMMGLNPGVTVLKFMRDVVIPFASSRVHSRLQGHTRFEKATGADKSKTNKIETPVDEGPAIVYRKGSSPDPATLQDADNVRNKPNPVQSSASVGPNPDNQPLQWDLGAHMRATAAARHISQQSRPQLVDPPKPSSSTDSSSSSNSVITTQRIESATASPAPFDRVPIDRTVQNILTSPISNSKAVNAGASASSSSPTAAATRVDGHPELIKIVCNGGEEIVGVEDLVANNYLLRSTVESFNTTLTSMQAIIKAQQNQINKLSGYIESQHSRIKDLNEQIAYPVRQKQR